MNLRNILIFCFSGISFFNFAQYNTQLHLVVDNDAFVFYTEKDRYYSSGIFASIEKYNQKRKNTRFFKQFPFHIYGIELIHKIYTPKHITWNNVSYFDRPYAGLGSVNLKNRWVNDRQSNVFDVQIGWMGPFLNTGGLQKTLHQTLNMPLPKGWEYQMQNRILFQSSLSHQRGWGNEYQFFSTLTKLNFGTIYSDVSQNIAVAFGKLAPFKQTSIVNNRQLVNDNKSTEMYWTSGVTFTYKFHDYTIQSADSEDYPYDKTIEAIQWTHYHGIGASWPKWDLAYLFFYYSPETTESIKHFYGRINLALRI